MSSDGSTRAPVKIAMLLTELSGYFASCLRELAALADTEVMVVCGGASADAPFDLEETSAARVRIDRHEQIPGAATLHDRLTAFGPDVVVFNGWQVPSFRSVARKLPGSCLRVVLSDHRWLATPRQVAGVLTSRLYLRPYFDVAFVPGDEQAAFARRLGFRDDRIWRGLYTCDHERFASTSAKVRSAQGPRCRRFLFVGRLVPEKGVATLAGAYAGYRAAVEAPWPLAICGQGPLQELFDDMEGAEVRGFVQPRDLPEVYAGAGCLVMPSLFEPWGVTIHEATASGLPVICSTACGAARHLVDDGVSGHLVSPGDVEGLASAMLRHTRLSETDRSRMMASSFELSRRYTPEKWAVAFLRRCREAHV